MDFAIKCFGIGECLMGQMVRLEIAPDNLDVIKFRCVFGQPLDGEPVVEALNRERNVDSLVNWRILCLGGGAFGNEDAWIRAAIEYALKRVSRYSLDILVVSYRQPSHELRRWVRSLHS